jgi:hypothetical protein
VITIGIDPHKRSHTGAAVDATTGELLGELTVPATEEGHERLRSWAHGLAGERVMHFALEDCRHVSGRLERNLVRGDRFRLRPPPAFDGGQHTDKQRRDWIEKARRGVFAQRRGTVSGLATRKKAGTSSAD